ncbi:FMN-binding negative transcriptional regulator [Sphingomonas sp. XXL09]|uniref:FMN-binding negative transcriptional regulator n=1 Tax=Sphingomonas sp. XXL09 TaxID=3457787 RepID=UPI00406BD43B
MLYTKPVFAPDSEEAVFALIDQLPLGTLITVHDGVPQLSHPVFVGDRAGRRLISHVARNNDHAALLQDGLAATAIFLDTGGYVSPSWYPAAPVRDSAPTWIFRVAHVHGRLRLLSRAETMRHLVDLVAQREAGRDHGWSIGELGREGVQRRLDAIQGFTLEIERIEASFCLGQDERQRDMAAAVAAYDALGEDRLAGLMRAARDDLPPAPGGQGD